MSSRCGAPARPRALAALPPRIEATGPARDGARPRGAREERAGDVRRPRRPARGCRARGADGVCQGGGGACARARVPERRRSPAFPRGVRPFSPPPAPAAPARSPNGSPPWRRYPRRPPPPAGGRRRGDCPPLERGGDRPRDRRRGRRLPVHRPGPAPPRRRPGYPGTGTGAATSGRCSIGRRRADRGYGPGASVHALAAGAGISGSTLRRFLAAEGVTLRRTRGQARAVLAARGAEVMAAYESGRQALRPSPRRPGFAVRSSGHTWSTTAS